MALRSVSHQLAGHLICAVYSVYPDLPTMPTSLTTLAHELLSAIISHSHSFADAISLSSVDIRLHEIWKTDSELILRNLVGNLFPRALERKLAFEILFELLSEKDDGSKLTVKQTRVLIDSVSRPVHEVARTLCMSWPFSRSLQGEE